MRIQCYLILLLAVSALPAYAVTQFDQLLGGAASSSLRPMAKRARSTSPETLNLLTELEQKPLRAGNAVTMPMPAPIAVPEDLLKGDGVAPFECAANVPQRVVSFREALNIAICNDPEIRQLALSVRMSLLDYNKSYSSYMPDINLVYSNVAERKRYVTPQDSSLSTNNRTATTGLELNWLLFDFGKREALTDQKKSVWLSSQQQTLSKFQDFVINFAERYYQLIAARSELTAAKQTENIARKTWDITQNKYHSGIGVLADALQAENALLSATQYRMNKLGQYKQVMGQVASLLNIPLASALDPGDSLSIPNNTQLDQLESLMSQAEKHHPALAAARQDISGAQAAVDVAKRSFLPSISLQAGSDRSRESLLKNNSNIDRTDSMYVGLSVKVPLFSGFSRYNDMRLALTNLSQTQQEYERIKKEILLNTWNTWQNLNTVNSSFSVVIQRVKTARRAYEIASGRYTTGVGNIIELLNTQQDLSQAEIEEANTRVQWYLLRLNLLANIGKLTL